MFVDKPRGGLVIKETGAVVSSKFFVQGAVGDVQFGQQFSGAGFLFAVGLGKDLHQLIAFALKEERQDHGTGVFRLNGLQKAECIENSGSSCFFVLVENIQARSVIGIECIVHEREAIVVEIFGQPIPIA